MVKRASFETAELRRELAAFLDTAHPKGVLKTIGSYRWGVYIFYDYDGEPIYVGQTKERIGTRIRRHLTNQRTDAVAMSVLDPFEVFEIEVFPLPEFEEVTGKHKDFAVAKKHLDALERLVHDTAIGNSKFRAILNEKDPPLFDGKIDLPISLRGRVVSAEVEKLRGHPDVRTARRAQVISRLAQVISEREVQNGLRRTLMTQAKRILWLAENRFDELGGNASVPKAPEEEEDEGKSNAE
ncbi:MAG TPA: GIY-YIG nuclease family protein [Bauldia sp.]|nr:GIY-YIG nuclease family protein [Bauldia sp.]